MSGKPNLPQVAVELFVYLVKHRAEVLPIIETFQAQYTSPLHNRFWRMFYSFFRKRAPDISKLKEQVELAINVREYLEPISNFYGVGKWLSTSANSLFMQQLLSKLESTQNQHFTEHELQEINTTLKELISSYLIIEEQREKLASFAPPGDTRPKAC